MKKLKRVLAVMTAMTAVAMCFASCSSKDEKNESDGKKDSVVSEATTDETNGEGEAVDVETTEFADPIYDADTGEEITVMSNIEFLTYIEELFGMTNDGSTEGIIKEAVTWDIVDEGMDPDAKVTREFLLNTAVRAIGSVDSHDEEAIKEFALLNGMIEEDYFEAFDLRDAATLANRAKTAWAHPKLLDDGEDEVTLQEGVVSLLNDPECRIADGVISIPDKYEELIEVGTIVIVNGDETTTGAYKVESIDKNGSTLEIKGTAAEANEVYKDMNVSFHADIDLSQMEMAE